MKHDTLGLLRMALCLIALAAPGSARAQDDEIAPAGNVRLPPSRPAEPGAQAAPKQETIDAPAPAIGLPLPPEPDVAPVAAPLAPAPARVAEPPRADIIPATPVNQDIPLPPLPPSRACAEREVAGVWRLLEVYERPASTEQAAFARARFQYMQFSPNSVLTTYASPNNDLTLEQIQARLNVQDNDNLQQYVYKNVANTGYIYFYSKGAPTNSMVCFIVATAKTPFAAGQMLLMPPREQSVGRRLVKVYERAVLPGAVVPGANAPKTPPRRRGRAPAPPVAPPNP